MSLPLDNPQYIHASPLLVPLDNTPMQYQGTNARSILLKDRKSKRNLMPADEDARKKGYISVSKRPSGTMNALGVRLCQWFVPSGNKIMGAICKVAFGETVDQSNTAYKMIHGKYGTNKHWAKTRRAKSVEKAIPRLYS